MYKIPNTLEGWVVQSVIRIDENSKQYSIPFDPANTDYQAYLKWVAEGNTPIPADGDTQ
jgi:hypothetical protein